ncbi:MAG: tetratricopeptide repeat protein [Bacteroidota bacterium]
MAILLTACIGSVKAQSLQEKLIDSAYSKISYSQFSAAKSLLSEAIRLVPNSARAHAAMGYVQDKTGQIEAALKSYDLAIKLDPSSPNAYFYKSEFYAERQDYKLSAQFYTEVLKLRPASVKALRGRAYAYRMLADYVSSEADYTAVINLEPDAWSYMQRGYIYFADNRYAKALSDFNKAVSLEPSDNFYVGSLINVLSNLRSFDAIIKANATFQANKKKDNHTELATVYAAEQILKKDYQKAYDLLEKADSKFTSILSLKAYVLEKLNHNEDAKALYIQALTIDKNLPEVKQELALLEKKMSVVVLADNLPPAIELISPTPSRGLGIVANGTATQVIGRAVDPSGLSAVTINGKAVKPEEDGLFTTSVILKAGLNQLLITATDVRGNKATKTFPVTVPATLVKVQPPAETIVAVTDVPPRFHALLIAEKDYIDPGIDDLANPVKDARDLRNILIGKYSFNTEDVDTLYNKSREEILQTLIQKCNALGDNDNLVIFYAGHGIAEKDKFGNVDGYWIPTSAKKGNMATYISTEDLNRALKRSNSRHILVIADACFSGAFTRSLTAAPASIQRQYDSPSRKIMASGNMEPVPDNSIFLKYLKQNLNKNQEKYLTAKSLFDSFYEAVLNNSETLPQFAAIKNVGDEGGQFVFIKK